MRYRHTFTWKISSTPTELVWNTNMAATLMFWNTNMANVTSCKKTLKSWENLSVQMVHFLWTLLVWKLGKFEMSLCTFLYTLRWRLSNFGFFLFVFKFKIITNSCEQFRRLATWVCCKWYHPSGLYLNIFILSTPKWRSAGDNVWKQFKGFEYITKQYGLSQWNWIEDG